MKIVVKRKKKKKKKKEKEKETSRAARRSRSRSSGAEVCSVHISFLRGSGAAWAVGFMPSP